MVLALCVSVPQVAAGQATQQSRDQGSGTVLGQNYPNPFVRETTIPFTIGGGASCPDPGRQFRVSIRIFNVLAQQVAIPSLSGGSAGAASGQPARNLVLTCGSYQAFWDGTITGLGRDAAPGMYLYQVEVDGRPTVRRMIKVK
jgi:hypothetical protein